MKCLILISSMFVLSSCTNPLGGGGSFVDNGYGPNNSRAEPAATGYEVVSGSQLAATTGSGTRKVDATIGASTSQIRVVTPQNRIVYISVQGQLNSSQ